MATFIKLSNGDVVNTQLIKAVKRHRYIDPAVHANYVWNKGFDTANIDENELPSTPAIQLQLGGDSNPLILQYESDQQRDAEFERIETILSGPRLMVSFGNRTFNPVQVQSMSVDWAAFNDTGLELRIKIPGLRIFMVTINKDNQVEWEKCLSLLAHFNMELPPVPTWDL